MLSSVSTAIMIGSVSLSPATVVGLVSPSPVRKREVTPFSSSTSLIQTENEHSGQQVVLPRHLMSHALHPMMHFDTTGDLKIFFYLNNTVNDPISSNFLFSISKFSEMLEFFGSLLAG